MKEHFSHFNFKEIEDNAFFISNDFGSNLVVNQEVFTKLVSGDISKESDKELYTLLQNTFFIINDDNLEHASSILQELKHLNFCKNFRLLVLKITNFCNYNCIYCQAKSHTGNTHTLMTFETAKNAIDMLIDHSITHIVIEFQGGEPLSNFTLIQEVIEYCRSIERSGVCQFSFRLMSNLSYLNNDIVDYLIRNNVNIGTSLDGPKELNDKARVLSNGDGIYDITQNKRFELERRLGHKVGLISTIPVSTLPYPKEFLQFYIDQDMSYLIRPLFKLGRADETWDKIGYTAEAFLDFYRQVLDLTLEHCKNNPDSNVYDRRSATFLGALIYGHKDDIEISSPCGSIMDMVSIDWNGDVVACEGSKMVAGDKRNHFVLGNVNTDDHISIFYGKQAQVLLKETNSESDPSCSRCAYQPFCGQCAVEKYISEDVVKLFNCRINEGMLDYLIMKLSRNDEYSEILKGWAHRILES